MAHEEFFSGKLGKATINGTEIKINGWTVAPEIDEHDVTNTGNNGFADYLFSIKRATFDIEVPFSATTNVLDDPINLQPGSELTNVKLYLNGLASPYWSFPTATVKGSPMTSKVNDITKITANCRARGTFTAPTGTFTPT